MTCHQQQWESEDGIIKASNCQPQIPPEKGPSKGLNIDIFRQTAVTNRLLTGALLEKGNDPRRKAGKARRNGSKDNYHFFH